MIKYRIVFVCLGNICRSPTAEAVFRKRALNAGLDVLVDSAGTRAWHAGHPPDPRTLEAGKARGYDFSSQRSRRIEVEDFTTFDHIIVMDDLNYRDILSICPDEHQHKVTLMLDYATTTDLCDVPDPYYGGPDGFEQVIDLIEAASDGLIEKLKD